MYFNLRCSELNSSEVGNKAFNLLELVKNGLNVPEAIILPINYFKRNNCYSEIDKLSKDLIDILPSESGWAVRSSSINEDSFENSMAGKFKTVIISSTDQLNNAIEDVLESAGNKNEMGVIIQKFIEPNFSGVVFSKHPVDETKGMVIEFSKGRGESVVSGLVTPWVYEEGLEDAEFTKNISREIIMEIKQNVKLMKDRLDYDLDMEFCVKGDTLYWVQVRPISNSQSQCSSAKEMNLTGEWFLFDQCTEPVAPLIQKLDPSGLFNSKYWDTVFINYYPYIKMKNISQGNDINFGIDILEEWYKLQKKYEPVFDEYLKEDVNNFSLNTLWNKTKSRIEMYRNYCSEYMNREWLMIRGRARQKLEDLIIDALGEEANVEIELSKLTSGVDTITVQKHLMLEDLVREAQQVENFSEIIKNLNSFSSHPWVKNFWDFINKFGFESSHALIFTSPTLAENPESLLLLIENSINKKEYTERNILHMWKEQADFINSRLSDEKKCEFIKQLEIFRNSLVRTENDDYLLQKGVASIRMILLEIGRRLKEINVLRDYTDIFFLYPSELVDVIFKPNINVLYKERIQDRIRYYEKAKREVPTILINDPSEKSELDLTNIFTGNIASSGVAEGSVYLLNNPLDRSSYVDIPENSIIVAPVLAPSLVYNLLSVSAIITEIGGFLSHGAIFAREKKIPAIVAVNSVMKRLKTGDRVRVDAEMGIIEILETV
ncbi:hypothetical protein EXW32_29950 (plasmid) [Bacillus mycoides]|uniref:PEP/pyruvate-binding domain-containing protein n=1 Tax=Bacillus mycoides TaxID=1405 RepID=UPI001C029B4E|nr:PEP/pyruvate-binding domain-containing protein [Bacillus mycoides]QWG70547.1 hypothetical protein EXW32_29950 [Bacillus mycoides]